MLQRDVVAYKGLLADTYTLGELKDPSAVIVFVPGNPGVIDYYLVFLTAILSELPPDVQIVAISQLGHTLHAEQGEARVATLQEQIDAKMAFLDELAEKHKGKKIILLGHSIGSYILLNLLKSRSNLIDSAHLLFPTCSNIGKSRQGKLLSPLFNYGISLAVGICIIVAACTSFAFRTWIVSASSGHRSIAAETTTRFISNPAAVRSCLTLAKEEMTAVGELDRALIGRLAPKLRFYFAKPGVDGWIRDEDREEIIDALDGKGEYTVCEENLPHDFCIVDSHAISVAKVCSKWIRASI